MKTNLMIFPLLLLLCFTFCCQQQAEEGITEAEAKTITDLVLKIWNEGDLTITDELYAADYIRHHPTPSANASLDDFKNTVTSNRSAFPDYNLAFDEMIIKEEKIIIRATMTGTNTAPIDERSATGKKVQMFGIYIFRISEGKIAEEWTFFNLLSYYQQLGFTITPPELHD